MAEFKKKKPEFRIYIPNLGNQPSTPHSMTYQNLTERNEYTAKKPHKIEKRTFRTPIYLDPSKFSSKEIILKNKEHKIIKSLQENEENPNKEPIITESVEEQEDNGQKLIFKTPMKVTYQGNNMIDPKINALRELHISRINKLDEILNTLSVSMKESFKTKNFQKIKDVIIDLIETFNNVSKTEILLNASYKEKELKDLEITKLKNKHEKLLSRCDTLSQKVIRLEDKNKLLSEENYSFNYLLQNEKNKNSEFVKRISVLENRLDIIVSNQENSPEMKSCLQDLIKENESLKRVIVTKNNEIDKANEANLTLKKKTIQLNKKITAMKIQKFTNSTQILENETEKNVTDLKKTTSFVENNLPITLDWRINHLKPEYANTLNDLVLYGGSQFAVHVMNLENKVQQKSAIELVSLQFISLKDFIEKFNTIIKEFLHLNTNCQNLKDLMNEISKVMPFIFNAEKVLLWAADYMLGIFYTFDPAKNEIRAISSSGLIGEFLTQNKTIFRTEKNGNPILLFENPVLETQLAKTYVKNVLLIPIKGSNNKTMSFLQISNFSEENLTLDEEYYALILAQLVKISLTRIMEKVSLQNEIKYKNLLFQSFQDLCKTNNKFEFTEKVQDWCKVLFAISTSKFLFYENNKLIDYSTNPVKNYENNGVAGSVIALNRPMIISEVRKNHLFDPNIDLSSLLPILYFPIKFEQEDEKLGFKGGIFQLILKQKNYAKKMKSMELGGEEGKMESFESLEVIAEKFSLIIVLALRNNPALNHCEKTI